MERKILKTTLTLSVLAFIVLSCKKTYDCPSLSLNFGDPCKNSAGQSGTVDSNCNCYVKTSSGSGGTTTYNCPIIKKNYGDSCVLNGKGGFIDSSCNCKVSSSGGGGTKYECPSIMKNYGDPCVKNGQTGKIDSNCTCYVKPASGGGSSGGTTGKKFCATLGLYVGDSCLKTGGGAGIVDSLCVCR